jgi:tagatose-6-phosphate ketose/aldose isomerase
MAAAAERIGRMLDGVRERGGSLVLTGSGSSFFAGECAALPLQEELGVTTRAVPAGLILTHPRGVLPASGPYVAVSLARSGDSPESAAVVEHLLTDERATQLLISCNEDGALARRYPARPRVESIVLPPETNDQSLVMTGSFTNLVFAARCLADPGDHARHSAASLASVVRMLWRSRPLAPGGRVPSCTSAAAASSGRESALGCWKPNAGRVITLADSFLGLRHGPMAAVGENSLIVAFLVRPSGPTTRRPPSHERKGSADGASSSVTHSPELARDRDVRLDVAGRPPLDDGELACSTPWWAARPSSAASTA